MARILVTGSGGQLGSTFVELTRARQEEWIFVDKEEMDLSDEDSVRSFLAKADSFDLIINTAAYTAVDKAETEEELAHDINALAPAILADYCLQQEAILVHFSTDYVYHNDLRRPLREDDPTRPQSVYAQTKLDGERLIQEADCSHLIFRTSWVFSPFGHNFVKTMRRLMKERDSLTIVDDQIGAPTYTFVLARTLLASLEDLLQGQIDSGVYNLSNAGETSWYHFAEAIRDLSGLECELTPIPSSDYPTPASRPLYSVLNTEKVRKAMGVKILPSWRESLEDCVRRLT